MRLFFFVVLFSFVFTACSKKELVLESISLAKNSVEGGVPLELCFKDLEGVNLDYDNFPTDNYLIQYSFTSLKGQVYKGESYLGGWQNNNCLLINAGLLSSKSHSYEENFFFNNCIVSDSLKSIEIKIYDGLSTEDLILNKIFNKEDFGQLGQNVDFYSY